MATATDRSGAMFTCLVCRREYAAADGRCPQCGARRGDNFVMADGATHKPAARATNLAQPGGVPAVQSASTSTQPSGTDDGMWILKMLETTAALVFLAAGVAVLLGTSWTTAGWVLIGIGGLGLCGIWLL